MLRAACYLNWVCSLLPCFFGTVGRTVFVSFYFKLLLSWDEGTPGLGGPRLFLSGDLESFLALLMFLVFLMGW